MAGHTNLGFESTEIETAISKATDLKTLSKNLDSNLELVEGDEIETSFRVKKSSKKKKFQSTSSGRIKNDLTVDLLHSGKKVIGQTQKLFINDNMQTCG
jgi:tyrosine-protein phosphatase YwqE